MGEIRDPVIILFGKSIQVPEVRKVPVAVGEDSGEYEQKLSSVILQSPSNKQDNHEPKHKKEETRILQEEKKIDEQNILETSEEKTTDQQKENSSNPMDKTLKKPDKILPCPRCNSMDTKFCYFNNYNVNQPRHFCKNCQRYWTEGGSMRNVPVGAGRRKNKSSTTSDHNHRRITISDCAQADFSESINHPSPWKANVTVFSFGADAPLCESMDPNGDNKLSRSLAATLNSNDEGNKALNSNFPTFPPYSNGAPWPNKWSHTPLYPVTHCFSMPWICSGLNSTVLLGKRFREGNIRNHINSSQKDFTKYEKCLWSPKTVKIDDHEKAGKHSVWAKLGFKSDKPERVLKNRSTEASQVLCANPAALSRSLTFQERS